MTPNAVNSHSKEQNKLIKRLKVNEHQNQTWKHAQKGNISKCLLLTLRYKERK